MTRSVTEKGCFLRFGYVSSYDAVTHTARVIFPELGNVVSAPLPVCVPSSSGNCYVSHMRIGSHVACVLSGQGTESGAVIGALYDEPNQTNTDANTESVTFSDGSSVIYDTENHEMVINVSGTVIISGHDVIISGESVTIQTEFTSMTFGKGAANISADVIKLESIDAGIKAQKDIALRSVDYNGSITVNKDVIKV